MREIMVDNFSGGGGVSTGAENATGRNVDIAINHDPEAIRMHQTNHPNTKHYCENVWDVDPIKVCEGRPVGLAWFSPDCKHFSKAKGDKPKDKNIRGLAWVALRWAAKVRPRVIMLENVEEFQNWGPLNRRHRPIKKKKGVTFQRFVYQLERLGYAVDYRELVAADYGAPTTRKRFFLIARCDENAIIWPQKTHFVANSQEVKLGSGKPYVGAYTQIDFSRPCPSIFDTAEEIKEKYGLRAVRPLAENTMKRIARGLKKFVLENPKPFLIQVNHAGERKPQCITEPMPTITAKHGFGLVTPFITQIGQTGFANDRSRGVEEPVTTIVSKNEHCLILPSLIQYHSETTENGIRGQELSNPILTVDGTNRYGLVSAFISKYYGTNTGKQLEEPLPTITADGQHHALCTTYLMQQQEKSMGRDLHEPLGTMTQVNHRVEVRAFLMKYYGTGTGQDLKEPLDTITANDRFGLVQIQGIDYQILDIGLRMLEPSELYGCQGFPADYIIDRDYTGKTYKREEQVKKCGNAVPPPFAEALIRANLPELCTGKRMPICRKDRLQTEENGQLRFA